MRNARASSSSLRFVVSILALVPWLVCWLLGAPTDASAGTLATPVVGGHPVARGEWPDVVAVFTADGGLCTGTLLAADLVLTAAHCVDAEPVEVLVDSIDAATPDGQRRKVKWARAYPDWVERYDVGVIVLEHPVFAKQRAVARGCTPSGRIAPGARVEVVGFGLTTRSATDSNTRLHAATIEVVDAACERDPACVAAVAPGGEFTAGAHGIDACFGDSGGPVYIATAHGPALVGVVSRGLTAFTEPCGEGGVFVRADKVVAWIQNVTDRVLDRVLCDAPAPPADDPGDDFDGIQASGCSAGGGAVGGLGALLSGGFAAYYAFVCVVAIRRARGGRRARTP